MSDDHGGPPPGWPPAPGGRGPVKTVLAQPAYLDQAAPPGGARVIPPTTIREPSSPEAHGAGGSSPFHRGPHGTPPPSPYSAPPPYAAPHGTPPPYGAYDAGYPAPQVPYGVPPPPRAGARRRGGPSLLVIGGVSTVVIGTVVTLIAIRTRPTSDDSSDPTIDVPTASAVTAEPPAPATPPDDPSTASVEPRPAAPPVTARPPRQLRAPRPGASARPGNGPPRQASPRYY